MVLFREDFSSGLFGIGEIGSSAPWYYYKKGEFIARDPKALISVKKRGLFVEIQRFTLTSLGQDDHPKFLFFTNAVNKETGFSGYRVPETGDLFCEVRASIQPLGTEKNPFAAPPDDYRLSCGAVVALDVDTHMMCAFFITDTKAYTSYGRLPPDQRVETPAAYFTYIKPAIEFERETEHTYKIAYSRERNLVTWYIDGRSVSSFDQFGRRMGTEFDEYSAFSDLPDSQVVEPLPLVQSQQLAFGAGLFTLLDAGVRHGKGLVNVSDPKAEKEKKLFGQGGRMLISDFIVDVSGS